MPAASTTVYDASFAARIPRIAALGTRARSLMFVHNPPIPKLPLGPNALRPIFAIRRGIPFAPAAFTSLDPSGL
jgi:hypothetical protein